MARLQEMSMTRGSRLLLILAVLAGLVAAGLVFVALSQNDDGGGVVSGGDASVVVATRDIDAGTIISDDLVTTTSVSNDQVVSGALTDTSLVVGEVARVDIYQNQQIVSETVGAENDTEGLSGAIPPGLRGFSVGVEEIRAVGGLLRPGNRVDVYISQTIENSPDTDDDDQAISQLIMQDIEVLAVAQEAQEPSAAVEDDSSSSESTTSGEVPDEVDEQPDAASVTLAVTPEQAGLLVCAQNDNVTRNTGDVWLAVRGYGEPHAEKTTLYDPCTNAFVP